MALFGLPHIRLVRLLFSAGTVFSSHDNSAGTVFFSQFQPSFRPPNGANDNSADIFISSTAPCLISAWCLIGVFLHTRHWWQPTLPRRGWAGLPFSRQGRVKGQGRLVPVPTPPPNHCQALASWSPAARWLRQLTGVEERFGLD